MKQATPIQRLLGLPVGADTPFDLLGVAPEECDPERVQQALSRQLQRLSRHPHGGGPEADEVRLALHSAAAQLADPFVRAQLMLRLAPSAVRPQAHGREAVGAQTPGGPRPPGAGAPSSAMRAFRESALPLFMGGRRLTPAGRRRLVALAHAHGLSLPEVRRALSVGGQDAARPAPPPAAPPAPKTVYQDFQDEMNREGAAITRQIRSAIIGLVAVLALVLFLVVAIALTLSGGDARSRERAAAADARARPEADAAGGEAQPPPASRDGDVAAASDSAAAPPRFGSGGDLLAELRALPARIVREPGEAAWRFDEAVGELARSWTSLDPAAMKAANEAVVEFLYRAAPGAESADRALAAVGAPVERMSSWADSGGGSGGAAQDVAPAAWSYGVLNRLLRERDLAPPIRVAAGSLLADALGEVESPREHSFEAGVDAGLRAMIDLLPRTAPSLREREPVVLAWREWLRVAEAPSLGPAAAGTAQSLALLAAEHILIEGPSPRVDQTTHQILAVLLASIEWAADASDIDVNGAPTSLGQARILHWFDDARIATRDLAVVTEWLARESRAPGVGIGLILRESADSSERARKRDQYAALWGMSEASPSDSVESAWARAATEVLAEGSAEGGTVAALRRAAMLARLNEAAARRWRQDPAGASAILADLRGPIEIAGQPQAAPPVASVFAPPRPDDGQWTVIFLSATGLTARLEALAALERRTDPLGPIDADVLVEAAIISGQSEIRDRAERIVRRRAQEATVLNAMLEALARAPRRAALSDLVEFITASDLPPVKDASWPSAARRALVERLLDRISAGDALGEVDRLASVIAAAYDGMRASASSVAGAPDPAASASALLTQWRAEAERYPASKAAGVSRHELDQRLSGRLRLAAGPPQRFAAFQVSMAEHMAAVIAAERPSREDAVTTVLTEMAAARRRSLTIGAQIESVEAAILRLWMIRLGLSEGDRS